jgi:hypothetical protein
MYINAKIIPIETIPEMRMGDKGESGRGRIQVLYM